MGKFLLKKHTNDKFEKPHGLKNNRLILDISLLIKSKHPLNKYQDLWPRVKADYEHLHGYMY